MFHTDRLQIEVLGPDHAVELVAALDHVEVGAFIGGPDVTTVQAQHERIAFLARGPADPLHERWLNFVVRGPNQQVIGRLEATVYGCWAEVAYLFDPRQWGRGYATEGLRWLIGHLATVEAVEEVWAAIHPDNQRSVALAVRVGFVRQLEPRRVPESFDDGDLVFFMPCLAALGAAVVPAVPVTGWTATGKMAIIAHRGGAALGEENSLLVLSLAQHAGAAAAEVDLHELGDGSLVLAHDSFVADDDWYWLRDLDLDGYERLLGRQPVTLGALVGRLQQLTLGLYLEMKSVSPHGVSRAIEGIVGAGLAERTLIGSFRADTVRQVVLDGRVEASVLFRSPWADPLALASDVGCRFVHPCFDDEPGMLDLMEGAWMRRVREQGVEVIGWNSNDPAVLMRMAEVGLCAACTDDPRLGNF